MRRSIVLILGICVFSTNSAIYRTQDGTFNRIARSPHEPPTPHGPPAPPILYHTQNWSGVAKGTDGAPQGVFSGAAASAQSADPTLSEAFSLATSGTGPVSSGTGGQVKGKIVKPGLELGNRFGDTSSEFDEGLGASFKAPGLEFKGFTSGSNSDESQRQSGQFKAGASGFTSGGYSRSSGHFRSVDFDKESGQRNVNSDISGRLPYSGGHPEYGSLSSQYGSSGTFGSRGDIESESGGTSAGHEADFNSQLGQGGLQTSSNGKYAHNRQSEQFNSGSGFRSKSYSGAVASSNQFGQNNDYSSDYQKGGASRGVESHGNGNKDKLVFEDQGGYGPGNFDHSYDDNHRHSKSHLHFEGHGKSFGYQGPGQGLGDYGQITSTDFSDSQGSSLGNNRKNYGSSSRGSRPGYSKNLGQVQQSRNLEASLTASQTSSQDISGSQQANQVDTGFSEGQAGSKGHSGELGLSNFGSTGYGYKHLESSSKNYGALLAGSSNDGISPIAIEGQLPTGVGASGQEDLQSTFGGALNLASQGLQAAQNAPCSTCNKGSYALSNAKSHSGSAIALSIGG